MKFTLFLPWFGGPLPRYFEQFKAAMQQVPDVRVVVLSDSVDSCIDGNFEFVNVDGFRYEVKGGTLSMTAAELAECGDKRKPCDFRPLLGAMFPRLTQDCHYWGWIDCDIVPGSFAKLQQAAAEGYDVISTAEGIVNGPLTLLRNGETCNYLFAQHDNWQQLTFGSREFCYFDEVGFTEVVRREAAAKRIRFWSEYCHSHAGQDARTPTSPGLRRMSDGRLLDMIQKREIVYFHFPQWDWWPQL